MVQKFDGPRYLADLLHLQNVYLGMGWRTSGDPFWLEVLRATSEQFFSKKTFSYIVPCLLKELDSIASFRFKLKTCLKEHLI